MQSVFGLTFGACTGGSNTQATFKFDGASVCVRDVLR
jgi:hypothetical protein